MENIIVTKENNISIIIINRPEALNALNSTVLNQLDLAIESIKKDDDVKVVIITGAGKKAFVAGADIVEMKNMNVDEAFRFAKLGLDIFDKLENMPKIVIAAVNGFALGGGCELAMACDIRIATENAKFGQPEVNLGIIPGFGGTQRLARLIGKAKALELICTGDIISAAEAEKLGLVNKVISGDVLDAAKELAQKVLARGQYAISYAKLAIHNGLQTDIKTALAYESSMFSLCFGNEQQKEGMIAFLEKRKPKF
ncbi:MAG: enoyl-CoA hydratase-related protein [Bacillota bacterium]